MNPFDVGYEVTDEPTTLRVAFTGHRPDKLGDKYNEIIAATQALMFELKPDYAIVGMAPGFDMLAGAICRQLAIPYEAAIPFIGHGSNFTDFQKVMYERLLDDADKVTIVSEEEYKVWLFQKRNEYMVDRCDILVACWDGTDGGTANCIKYAKKVGRKILYLNWDTWKFEER